ncbi:tRNA-dihydrouridine(47) synthase [NAD(P)(+)]-like [Rhynochetos jubatus]
MLGAEPEPAPYEPGPLQAEQAVPVGSRGRAEKCCFGPRCRFLGDVGEYTAVKPADLGRSRVLFETFGKCVSGVTCRFGQAHLRDGHRDIVSTALARQREGKALVRNSLCKADLLQPGEGKLRGDLRAPSSRRAEPRPLQGLAFPQQEALTRNIPSPRPVEPQQQTPAVGHTAKGRLFSARARPSRPH